MFVFFLFFSFYSFMLGVFFFFIPYDWIFLFLSLTFVIIFYLILSFMFVSDVMWCNREVSIKCQSFLFYKSIHIWVLTKNTYLFYKSIHIWVLKKNTYFIFQKVILFIVPTYLTIHQYFIFYFYIQHNKMI